MIFGKRGGGVCLDNSEGVKGFGGGEVELGTVLNSQKLLPLRRK